MLQSDRHTTWKLATAGAENNILYSRPLPAALSPQGALLMISAEIIIIFFICYSKKYLLCFNKENLNPNIQYYLTPRFAFGKPNSVCLHRCRFYFNIQSV